MLSKLAGRLIGRTAMEVYINLDRDDAIYTNQDTISGDIILITRSSMKISTITVNLSGIATSRLDQGKSEVHQVLCSSPMYRVFFKLTPMEIAGASKNRSCVSS